MSTATLNLEEVQTKLYERLKPSGWADKLKTFMLSRDMITLLQRLHEETLAGHRFTPPLKYVFRAMEECPWSKIRAVIIGQDPYPQLGVADGISFSCSLKGKPEKSLKYIFKEINETVYPDIPETEYNPDPDLKRWANQGVLMLNTALTTRVGEIGSQYDIWKEFTRFTLSQISALNYAGLVFVFLGSKAKEWAELISDNHYKLFVNHPSSASYSGGQWSCKNLFNEVNQLLTDIGKDRILW
jgi:uracil-DNA glycosylase